MAGHARQIIDFLEDRYGPIKHRYAADPFKVIVACIISQRTREENTERVTRALFAVASTPRQIVRMPLAKLQRLIKSSGTYRQKARNIKAIARIILEKYNGNVPRTRTALLALPGIGPKCSAIVLSYGFGIPIIAVDTNVNRVAKRLGLVGTKDDVENVRIRLQDIFPRSKWYVINLGLVGFGREICKPGLPLCTRAAALCPFSGWCVAYRAGRFSVS